MSFYNKMNNLNSGIEEYMIDTVIENKIKEYATNKIFRNIKLIIIKPTNQCNMSCSYCFDDSEKSLSLDLDIYKKFIENIFTLTKSPTIRILFHGGEPTLINNDWYQSAINYTDEVARTNKKKVRYNMQTNGLLLSKKRIHELNEFGVQIGVSIDGPDASYSSERQYSEEVVKVLKEIRSIGITPGILMTINQSNFNKMQNICDWLHNDLKISRFKLNPIYDFEQINKKTQRLTADQIQIAKVDVLNYMISTQGNTLIEENLITEIRRFLNNSEEYFNNCSVCDSIHCGAGVEVITLNPGGSIFPCGRFSTVNTQYKLGDVSDFDDMTKLPNIESRLNFLIKSKNNFTEKCFKCPANRICNYGCIAFNLRNSYSTDEECIAAKIRLQYYSKHINEIFSLYKRLQTHKFDDSLFYSDSYSDDWGYSDSSGGYNDSN